MICKIKFVSICICIITSILIALLWFFFLFFVWFFLLILIEAFYIGKTLTLLSLSISPLFSFLSVAISLSFISFSHFYYVTYRQYFSLLLSQFNTWRCCFSNYFFLPLFLFLCFFLTFLFISLFVKMYFFSISDTFILVVWKH